MDKAQARTIFATSKVVSFEGRLVERSPLGQASDEGSRKEKKKKKKRERGDRSSEIVMKNTRDRMSLLQNSN